MKYDYLVKYNGVYYPAGQDVPDSNATEVKSSVAKAIVEEETHKLTREEIESMNYMALKKIARDNGIEHDKNIKQADLRELLCKHFGL